LADGLGADKKSLGGSRKVFAGNPGSVRPVEQFCKVRLLDQEGELPSEKGKFAEEKSEAAVLGGPTAIDGDGNGGSQSGYRGELHGS
jgi:hypothetical protein